MGIFDKKQSIRRDEMRTSFRKDRGFIPGGEGKYSQGEREKMSRELFGGKYGSEISKQDYRGALRDLTQLKSKAKSGREKEVIDDKIKYLRQLGGKGF